MDPRRIASTMAVVGGVGWMARAALFWYGGGEAADAGLASPLFYLGLVAFAVALAAAGYTLVETAPAWLRAVVAMATPLLVLLVWLMVDEVVDPWLHEEGADLASAVIAVIFGMWAHKRAVARAAVLEAQPPRGTRRAEPPVRGRRAAR